MLSHPERSVGRRSAAAAQSKDPCSYRSPPARKGISRCPISRAPEKWGSPRQRAQYSAPTRICNVDGNQGVGSQKADPENKPCHLEQSEGPLQFQPHALHRKGILSMFVLPPRTKAVNNEFP